ncbi:thermonuclease family protein [Salinarimonas ramus]|uniref:Succinoglycan biosynthesis protein n=1 Tax=Salinarimonas ramus TaxID=690164 RepID=A0A917V6A9_9HYPH|nr:thermonuclease family protein [Salinarimonas ramus]GGK43881.1 succinoglycan biosynthesis protein [Salinarimonas ramus]
MPRLARFALLAALAALPLASTAFAADGDVHRGVARVADGDTLDLGGDRRIRLFGIDAPELDQSCERADGSRWDCGRAAMRRLEQLADGRTILCEEVDRDPYERIVGICRAGDRDLNGTLVSEGLAFAYRDFSDRYVANERAARASRAGMFAGEATAPWEHRAAQRGAGRTDQTASVGPGGCTIKGNVSRSGRRLYHTQDSPDWERTRIDERDGERWFCSEAEARAAGWQKAHR